MEDDDEEGGVVAEGYSDVCMRGSADKMRSEATGRKLFQKVHLVSLGGLKKSTNRQYCPEEDCEPGARKLPGEYELIPTENSKEYLEVGLVIGKDPSLHMATGKARDKNRELQRKKRGVLNRDEFAMRVFTPTTEYVKDQCKYFVGCHPIDARLSPKPIQADRIFFYPEFWSKINHIQTVRERLVAVNKACRHHAASQKMEERLATALIVADDTIKTLVPHPSTTTTSDHLASLLFLQHSMYIETGNPMYVSNMRESIKKALGCGGYGPKTSTEGVYALLDFTEALPDGLAKKAKNELEVS